MDPLNTLAKFEICSVSCSWDNRDYPKMGSPWICPRFLCSKMFHGLLFGCTLLLVWPNLKFVALPVPEIIAIGVSGRVRTPNLGEGEAVWGRGWYRSKERRWVPHSNFFSIFTRFRDIAAFVLQNAIFPIPPLLSPKFPHVFLGVGGWSLGYKERRCWANCPCG